MDFLTKKERSKRMSLIRSKWTKQEKKVHNLLKGRKIRHKMHPSLPGNPDILINKKVVFIHGCFWHKCPQHYKQPNTQPEYWRAKIERNARRHKKNIFRLRKLGFKTMVVWEHQVSSDLERCIEKMIP